MAVGAVDLEPGPGASVECAAFRVVPRRKPRRPIGRWRSGERAAVGPVGELVLRSFTVGEMTVEVASLRTDRHQNLAGCVAPLALVHIGNDVIISSRAAVGVNPAH